MVSIGIQTDDLLTPVSRGVQTNHRPLPFFLASNGVQTRPTNRMPEVITLDSDSDEENLPAGPSKWFEKGVMGPPTQPPPPPSLFEEARNMTTAEERTKQAVRQKKRGHNANDEFTHVRPSTSAGINSQFRSVVGSNLPQNPDVVPMAIPTDPGPDFVPIAPRSRLTTTETQTEPTIVDLNPQFVFKPSGALNQAFPEMPVNSALPSILAPAELLSYEHFPQARENMYLVAWTLRNPYMWVTEDFIHSRHPELVHAFVQSNPYARGSAAGSCGESDGFRSNGSDSVSDNFSDSFMDFSLGSSDED